TPFTEPTKANALPNPRARESSSHGAAMAHGLGTALKEKFSFNVGRRALAVCAPDPLRAPESRRLRKNFRGGSVIVYKGGDAGPWSLLGEPSGDRTQDPLIKSSLYLKVPPCISLRCKGVFNFAFC